MDRRLLVLALGMFAMGTDNFVVAGILHSVALSLHTSDSLAGQMVSIYALSFAVLAPLMAVLLARWPRKLLLVSALATFFIGNALSAVATDLNTVLISRALAGLGAAMFAPTALGVATVLASPEKRGQALATVTAGLTGATALGAPIGTFIGGLADWRTTLWFVAIIGLLAMAGVWALFRAVPQPPVMSLKQRFGPIHDPRIALTLFTTLLTYGGFLVVYTYVGLVMDRATGGDGRILAGMLLVWGLAATVGNLLSGKLVDLFDSRVIINWALCIAGVNFFLLPWASAHLWSASISLIVWALCGWGMMVPQQHRLVKIAPQFAAVLLALNNTAFYLGLACAGVIGGLVLLVIDRHYLSWVGAGALVVALILAEITHFLIVRKEAGEANGDTSKEPVAETTKQTH